MLLEENALTRQGGLFGLYQSGILTDSILNSAVLLNAGGLRLGESDVSIESLKAIHNGLAAYPNELVIICTHHEYYPHSQAETHAPRLLASILFMIVTSEGYYCVDNSGGTTTLGDLTVTRLTPDDACKLLERYLPLPE